MFVNGNRKGGYAGVGISHSDLKTLRTKRGNPFKNGKIKDCEFVLYIVSVFVNSCVDIDE